jgi:hypothetical protein
VVTGVKKGLGLLTEMVPEPSLIAIMVNPANPQMEASAKEIQSNTADARLLPVAG